MHETVTMNGVKIGAGIALTIERQWSEDIMTLNSCQGELGGVYPVWIPG
jgi:hypothetical protein